jgi:hypothetical protein
MYSIISINKETECASMLDSLMDHKNYPSLFEVKRRVMAMHSILFRTFDFIVLNNITLETIKVEYDATTKEYTAIDYCHNGGIKITPFHK